MTDPQKWTDEPSPTQLRDFYAGTVLGHIQAAMNETSVAMEEKVIPRRSGSMVLDALADARAYVKRTGVKARSSEAETRVMK